MAVIHAVQGEIGVEALGRHHFDELSYRLWFDKGAGKYRTIEVTFSELQRIHQMIGGVLGGSQLKPPRSRKQV